jgi:MoxR-like ATPase
LKWIIQKQKLSQDIYLIGEPGPYSRQLALIYCQLTKREVEYVVLSRDISDGDLKQRREIINNTVKYIDQQCVRAAIHGRVLILDGIQKAERNVLPLLNNLLENREMELDNKRFLTNPDRFDLLKDQNQNVIRVSEQFQVIAIGLPVPKNEGFPLDPPFRSRFQSRYISIPDYETQSLYYKQKYFSKFADISFLETILKISFVLRNVKSDQGMKILDFPSYLDRIMELKLTFNHIKIIKLIEFCYPPAFIESYDQQMKNICFAIFKRFGVDTDDDNDYAFIKVLDSGRDENGSYKNLNFGYLACSEKMKYETKRIHSGPFIAKNDPKFVLTPYHKKLVAEILLATAVGHVCLIGDQGTGKSVLVRHIASVLGYNVMYLSVFRDMSTRDFFQTRDTDSKGNTLWKNSTLISAALNGHLCILDPVECLSPGVLASLQRLLVDQETTLPDGKLLVSKKRFESILKEMNIDHLELNRNRVYQIDPAFRVFVMGRPFNTMNGKKVWINGEILTMFSFVCVREMKYEEEYQVVSSTFPKIKMDLIKTVVRIAEQVRSEENVNKGVIFSTRQVMRVCKRLGQFNDDCVHALLLKVFLYSFLPLENKELLLEYLKSLSVVPKTAKKEDLKCEIVKKSGQRYLQIGNISYPVAINSDPTLVPNVLFYQNQKQVKIMQDILKDYILGEHILVIGSQGVGKNKIVDYFLQLLNLPREYIQLHRDTTVSSLTVNPTIVDGVLKFEDSALVRAVRYGYVLVVDEVDKAQTYVTSILKTLVDDGEMALSDGRRIMSKENISRQQTENSSVIKNKNIILIHDSFRMILLANKPGFPFLGNDFYKEIGDVFATHCVENPDFDSEYSLLKNYGKDVPDVLLNKLISSFQQLRLLVDEGVIAYPYSTRELVNVVKHLQEYPEDGVPRALQNVFDFDKEEEVMEILVDTMNKNGIPIGHQEYKVSMGEIKTLNDPVLIEKWRLDKYTITIKPTIKDLNIRVSKLLI